jgi:site-specific recombinase XerD
MEKLIVRKIEHRGETRIECVFGQYSISAPVVRQIPGRRWSATRKSWHIPYDVKSWKTLQILCGDKIEIATEDNPANNFRTNPNSINKADKTILVKEQVAGIENKPEPLLDTVNGISKNLLYMTSSLPSPGRKGSDNEVFSDALKLKLQDTGNNNNPAFSNFIVLKPEDEKIAASYKAMLEIKKYSPATISIYLPFFRQYLKDFESTGKPIDGLHYSDMHGYVTDKTRNMGATQTRQLISAIKFYYEKILGHQKLYFNLGSSHDIRPHSIQFDLAEMQGLAGPSIRNSGHRLCLWLVFYLGLRAEDLVNLTPDIGNCLQKNIRYTENTMVASLLQRMAENHLESNHNSKFVFEKKSLPFSVGEMRQFIWWLVSYYKLEAIYRVQFRNMMVQTNLEKTTMGQYTSHFIAFIRDMHYKNPAAIGTGQIKEFLHNFGKGRSADTQNAMVTALRFYYKYCLKREFLSSEMPRARKPKIKPQVLGLEEVAAIIGAIDNEKQRNLMGIIYSAGLRRSEARNLKLADIDYSRGLLFIKAGKGRKDRFTLLSQSLSGELKSYIEKYKPQKYVFEGEKAGNPYSFTSMDKTLKRAVAKAGILKRVNLHLLRHSFATHVIEDGYDIRYLQQLLGHNSLKTTQRYTHLTNESVLKVRSPYDKLKILTGNDKHAP